MAGFSIFADYFLIGIIVFFLFWGRFRLGRDVTPYKKCAFSLGSRRPPSGGELLGTLILTERHFFARAHFVHEKHEKTRKYYF